MFLVKVLFHLNMDCSASDLWQETYITELEALNKWGIIPAVCLDQI